MTGSFPSQHHGELYILAGVTASGKSNAALEWACSNDAEILSCDSISFYKGMDIGSAKPTFEERKRVPHYGIDLFEVRDPCDVGRYAEYAQRKVGEIISRGRKVLVVGGSGFYLQSFFSSMVDQVEIKDSVREQVDDLFNSLGLVGLLQRLRSLNPDGLGELDVLNPRRVIRALERCLASGKNLATLKQEFDSLPKSFPNFKKKVLWLNREDSDLVQRIEERTRKMLERGLLDETRTLLKLGLAFNPAASSSIGYREAVSCLQGNVPECELNQLINASTRKLVSKQRKWFRKHLGEKSHLVLNHGQELEGTDLLWDSGT